jgi:MOSC domain-containing protein YiiM
MQIQSVNIGSAQLLIASAGAGTREVLSGINKRPVTGAVAVRRLGLGADVQVDLSVHGGLDKAIYAYPQEHYALWTGMRAQALKTLGADQLLQPGAFGENLTLTGLLERDAWVGDVLRFANCTLVINQPRIPCFKFNIHMGFAHASKMMIQSGTCGYYLSVLDEGFISAGERFTLEAGPRHLSIPELFEARTRRARQQEMF